MSPADKEALVKDLEATGEYRVLRRLATPERYAEDDGSEKILGLVLDVETTGLDSGADEIIELGAVLFEFNREGRVFRVLETADWLEDPGRPIPPEITALTGLTDEAVRGRRVDDDALGRLSEKAVLVLAHNAAFDRPFVEKRFPWFMAKHWACTSSQVPWKAEGLAGAKLEYLAYGFGFFYDPHRASADCQAALHVLAQRLPVSGRPALAALLEAARRVDFRLWAIGAPMEAKDLLRGRGYRWSPGEDGRPKGWNLVLPEDRLEAEKAFLRDRVYGRAVDLRCDRIAPRDRFSARA